MTTELVKNLLKRQNYFNSVYVPFFSRLFFSFVKMLPFILVQNCCVIQNISSKIASGVFWLVINNYSFFESIRIAHEKFLKKPHVNSFSFKSSLFPIASVLLLHSNRNKYVAGMRAKEAEKDSFSRLLFFEAVRLV